MDDQVDDEVEVDDEDVLMRIVLVQNLLVIVRDDIISVVVTQRIVWLGFVKSIHILMESVIFIELILRMLSFT